MTDIRNHGESPALVHWTYSRDEWDRFIRWQKRKKGFLYYLAHRLFSSQNSRPPDITITGNKVCVDGEHEQFHDDERQLQRVNIHDAGNMNIMEISYHRPDQFQKITCEINIPVPKGRIREAIQLQQKLGERF